MEHKSEFMSIRITKTVKDFIKVRAEKYRRTQANEALVLMELGIEAVKEVEKARAPA